MSACRVPGCTTEGSTLCYGGKDIVEWICADHRSGCRCGKCDNYRATTRRDGSLSTSYKECVLCPHCGLECNDEYESKYWGEASKGDTFEVECNHCEMKFEVEPHVEIKYSTEKKDCDHGKWINVISYKHQGDITRCRECGMKKPEDIHGEDQVS